MRLRSAVPTLAIAALCLAAVAAPAAQAGSRPVYLFLRDMETPPVDQVPRCSPAPSGAPIGDGELTVVPPCPLNLVDPQNNSAPQTRVIVPASELVHPTQFVLLNQSLNTGEIWGPVVVLLYVPESPTMQSGNLSVQLVALPKTYSVADVGATGTVLANATIDVTYHNTTGLPQPTSLIPPDPTNVTATEGYIAAQLLFFGFTQLAKAQYILYLDDAVKDRIIHAHIDPEAKLALRFSLVPSTTPGPIPLPLPAAQGAGQPIAYDFALTPALVYVPWFKADPVPPVNPNPNPPPPPQPCYGCSSTTGGSSSSSESTHKSGAPESVFVMTVLAAALLVRRRHA